MKAGDFQLAAFGFMVCWTLYSFQSPVSVRERGLRWRSLGMMKQAQPSLLVDMDAQHSPLLFERDIPDTSPATTTTTVATENKTTSTIARERKIPPKRTLVVYSGPSTYQEEKHELYQLNLQYFIANGGIVLDGTCPDYSPSSVGNNNKALHDTIIVVGHEFYEQYYSVVEKWKASEATRLSCPQNQWTNQISVVARRPVCYDMESARLAFQGGLGVNIVDYDYFVFLNCGITGPGNPEALEGKPWTTAFTSKFNDKVKMSGLSLNMFGLNDKVQEPHLQSFLYALDRVGIQVIRDKKAIFDCVAEPAVSESKQPLTEFDKLLHIVRRYELGMSAAILDAGYALAPYLNYRQPKCDYLLKSEITYDNSQKKCLFGDMWHAKVLKRMYWGRIPTLDEVLFFKTSRLIPLEIVQKIGYNAEKDVVWGLHPHFPRPTA